MRTPLHRSPRRIFAALAGWVAALAFPVSAAPAAIHGWLTLGPEVPGESTAPGHPGWMDFDTASVTGEAPLPGSALSFRKRIDKASPLLMKSCATGKVFEKANVHWAVDAEGPSVFFMLVLNKVRVISVKHEGPNGSAGGPPFEDLELVHDGVRMTYIQLSDPTQLPLITNLPFTGDTDGDGMPDSFEEQFGLQLHSDDRDLDSDNDGLTNFEEFEVGTDPSKGTSFFKATAVPSPDGLVLTWNSVPGATYNILYSPNLAEPFEVVETVEATGPSTSNTQPRAGIKGFYKVEKAEP